MFESSGATAVFVATIVGSAAVEWIVTYRERRVTDAADTRRPGERLRIGFARIELAQNHLAVGPCQLERAVG